MGNKHWTRVKNNPYGEYEYQLARNCYETAKKARESASKMK